MYDNGLNEVREIFQYYTANGKPITHINTWRKNMPKLEKAIIKLELDKAGVPDVPAVLYIDLPTEHQGDELTWSLHKETKYRLPGGGYMNEEEYQLALAGDKNFYCWNEASFYLVMTVTRGEKTKSTEQQIDSPADANIIKAAKTLVDRKEMAFRYLLLDHGDVSIQPKPKPVKKQAPDIGTTKK